METGKRRHTIWLDDDVWNQVRDHYRANNCTTQNEYIEKAIRFYTGYLNADRDEDFFPSVLMEIL